MLTLGDAKSTLSRYIGANNVAVDRINLVTERLLKSTNARGTKVRARFGIYTDVDGQSVITLPRSLNTVLAGNIVTCTTTCGTAYSAPLRVRNSWYEFLPGGVGVGDNLCV